LSYRGTGRGIRRFWFMNTPTSFSRRFCQEIIHDCFCFRQSFRSQTISLPSILALNRNRALEKKGSGSSTNLRGVVLQSVYNLAAGHSHVFAIVSLSVKNEQNCFGLRSRDEIEGHQAPIHVEDSVHVGRSSGRNNRRNCGIGTFFNQFLEYFKLAFNKVGGAFCFKDMVALF